MPHAKPRIPASRLTFAHETLFGRSVFTGAALARAMNLKDVTLWSWFSRRGLTAPDARTVADRISEWALKLQSIAVRLRRMADELEVVPPTEEAPAPD